MAKNRRQNAPAAAPAPQAAAAGLPLNARLWAGFIAVAAVIAFGPALHGGWLWDDDVYVTNNLLLTAPDGLRRIWFSLDSPSQYFPLTYTTFLVERLFWGLDTFGYHAVNLLLHVANAYLVWLVLAALEVPGAWLAAGIFALHPVQVESVAWITERKNVLSGFFFLLSLRAWIKTLDPAEKLPDRAYAASFAYYLLALFAKTTACTLPAALVIAAWMKGARFDRKRVLQLASYLAGGVGMGVITIWWEKHQQGTQGASFSLTHLQAVLVSARALWFYAGKLVWPVGLSFSYPRWDPRPDAWTQWLWPGALAVLGGALAWLWRRGRPQAAYAFLFFAATLSPLLGFIPLFTFRYTYVADHYQYMACAALIALFSAAVAVKFWPEDAKTPRFHPAVLVLFAVLVALTAKRSAAFGDAEALWRDTIAASPDSWMAYDNLGCVLMDKGQLAESEADLRKSVALKPDEYRTRYNLGNLLVKAGRKEEALASYGEALRLEPDHIKSLFASAGLLVELGRDDEAAAFYRRGLGVDKTRADGHVALGILLSRQGNTEQAAEEYRQAIAYNPRNGNAHNNLANIYLKLNRVDDAVAEYHAALEISPGFAAAHFNLGVALQRQGNAAAAASEYESALAIEPGFAAARRSLEGLRGASAGGRPLVP
jgi:tetratricopeptide (TPR) repeat protein